MNPRHRRLMFPGLLILLLLIVVVSSLADKASAAADGTRVTQLSDPRITESSGLVVSQEHEDLVYTVNDSGNRAQIFAVQLSTGNTVGTATVDAEFVDTEALSIDSSATLWIADTGDNNRVREDVALYSLPEFGPRDAQAAATRYPLVYPDGPRDVEALVINPRDDSKFLLTKGLMGGEVYAVPTSLKANQANRLKAVDGAIPGMVTDAAFAPDGRHVVVRNYVKASILDAATWQSVASMMLPVAEQGETLAMEATGTSFLVGSEGSNSPVHRIAFEQPAAEAETAKNVDQSAPQPTPTQPADESPNGGNGFAGKTWLWAGIAVALLAAVAVAANRRD